MLSYYPHKGTSEASLSFVIEVDAQTEERQKHQAYKETEPGAETRNF